MTSKVTSKDTKYLFVGNPGTGKSTMLNSLVGEVMFKSGVSLGSGMTYQLDTHEDENGNVFMDTPGLADPERRKQAATTITAALQGGGDFKIIFVLTLEAGRVRPADKTTMKAILDSAPIRDYGVIINKVTEPIFERVCCNPGNEDPPPLDKILACLSSGLEKTTTHIHLNRLDAELLDRDNKLVPFPDDLCEFIEAVPTTSLKEGEAKQISVDEFEKLEKMFEEKFAAMERSSELMRKELQSSGAEVKMIRAQLSESRDGIRELQRKLQEAQQSGKDSQAEISRLRRELAVAKSSGAKSSSDGGCSIL